MTTTQETPDDSRLTRLEITVDYLVKELGEIRAEMRLQREDTSQRALATQHAMESIRQELEAIRQESRRDFRWIIGTFIGVMIPTWAFTVTALFFKL